MSSILESVVQADGANYGEANYAINMLHKVQSESTRITNKLDYTPEMVPIVRLESSDFEKGFSYCIDGDCFNKMINSQDLSVEEGVNAMFSQLQESDSEVEDISEMSIVLKEQNVDDLFDAVKENATKFMPRLETVNGYLNYIDSIKQTGCNVVFCMV